MKILSTVFIFIISISLFGCTSGNEVSGRSIKSANRSVNRIKDRLPTEQRIEFEVSYWTLRDSIKTRDEFLDTVGGKTPEQLIKLGKEVFQQRKNTGFKNYYLLIFNTLINVYALSYFFCIQGPRFSDSLTRL